MRQENVENMKAWFRDYVAGFFGNDEFVNSNIRMKEQHTWRTCEEILLLARRLELSVNQKRIAELIALLHDIGRFKQFSQYRTYDDSRSVDHSMLGLEVLAETNVLQSVDPTESSIIETAIEHHGRKQLPADLDGQHLFFARLIRDADKIDILYTVTEYYEQYHDDPAEFMLQLELPDEPRYSAEVVESILRGELVDYTILRTLNDIKLCRLGWVYDVTFTAALRRIKQRKFLDKLIDFLPRTQDTQRVKEKIFAYVDCRLRRNGNND